jgi:hypothetical protein
VAVALLTGCAAGPAADSAPAVVDHQAFRDQLARTAQAVNAGDLEEAKSQLRQARSSTTTTRQAQKVEGLEQLIAGAEALRAGDPEGARSAWARIEEPHLRREVRHKARLIGLEVPVVSDGQEGAMP